MARRVKREGAIAAQRRIYAEVKHRVGPATYWKASGYDLLYKFAGFERGKQYRVLDLMSGAGLVGREIAKRAQKNRCRIYTTFIDISAKQLAKIKETWTRSVKMKSAFQTEEWEGNFQRVFCRYGIKNWPARQQPMLLKEIARLMPLGGRFILQDMVSPPGLRHFMNAERGAKAKAAGDTVSKLNIPTEAEWKRMIKKAGLRVEGVTYTTSKVNTKNWVESGQMTAEAVKSYVDFLSRAIEKNQGIKKALKIKKRGSQYEITYPVILIRAAKGGA